ncbi:hypothetical protein FRC19_001156 [Serendipita sp. 401]|nr:hypothetical protein FRC19_001156 [Serendipita sp. 401]
MSLRSSRMKLSAFVAVTFIGAVRAEASVDDKARIALACLLGGVPGLSIIVFLCFCVYIRKRKASLRKHAIANGIELDEEGWPVHPALRAQPSNHTTSQVGDGRASATDSQNRQQYQVRRFSLGGGRVDDFIIRSYTASGIDTKYVPPYYRTNPVGQPGASALKYPPRESADTTSDGPTTTQHAY